MGALLTQIIPLGLIGAIMPTRITIAILMLTSKKPLRNGLAYLAGLYCLCAAVGLLLLILFSALEGIKYKDSMIGATAQVVAGSLFLLLGVRSVLDTPDPDAPSPRWLERIQAISTGGAFVLGLILALGLKLLMILVSAVAIMANANVTVGQRVVVLIFLIALILLGVIIPIGFYASNPKHASAWLSQALLWLKAHTRAVTIVLSFVLGAFFLFNGVAVLR